MGRHLVDRVRRPFIQKALAQGLSYAAIADWLHYTLSDWLTVELYPEPFVDLLLRYSRASSRINRTTLPHLWMLYHAIHPEAQAGRLTDK